MKKLLSKVEVLSPDEIRMIHNAALSVLEKTGLSLPNQECLRRTEKAGAQVDYTNSTIKIPKPVMEELIEQIRANSTMPTEECSSLTGHISTQVFVTDYKTKTKRRGTTDDILRGIELVKHLQNVPSCSAVTIPSDVSPLISDLHSFHLIYKYSKKDGGTYVVNPDAAEYIMDMAEALGRKTGYLFETISPLKTRTETLEMSLRFADRGHSLSIAPMIMGGSTGPITMAGTLTLITAEVLASIFAVYAISGQLTTFFGHGSHTTDPKTMLCSFGSPNQALIGIGAAQMGKFYGIHSGSNSALSDALMPDFQCGFEKAFSTLFSVLAGTCIIGCQGIAGADQGFSFEQLVIDNEWLDAYNYVVSGYEVTEETIAEQLIHEIGIGGNFLSEEHTVDHLGDSWWHSKLFDRLAFDTFVDMGGVELVDKAAALVKEYTKGYQTMELAIDGTQADELDRIYNKAVQKLL